MTEGAEKWASRTQLGRRAPRATLLLVAVVLFLAGLGYLGYRWATNDALAVLTQLAGKADRDTRQDIGKWIAANLGDEFGDGDGARTETTSEAHFQLFSGARLTLKPASQIRFGRREGEREAVGLTVEVGEVDVRTGDRTLTINSQFGEVVIDPNSLIRLRRNGSQMMMTVEVGGLELTKEGAKPQRYAAGQTFSLAIGGLVVDRPAPGPGDQQGGAKDEVPAQVETGDGIDHTDLSIPAGESCVIHDPAPPTALGVRFGGVCSGPARLSIGRLRTEAEKEGRLPLQPGEHDYIVRCLDTPDIVAARGSVRVLRDAGTRKLPGFTPQASVATDGRNYTVLYQSRLPQVSVSWPGAPGAEKYFLVVDGASVATTKPTHTLQSGGLQPGVHKIAFRAVTSPPRQSRTTTVVVKYDAQAPTARVSEPAGDFAPGASVPITGQALPGWTVSLNGQELELDGRRQFSTEIRAAGTVAVAFFHPERGRHYYLRRPRTKSQ